MVTVPSSPNPSTLTAGAETLSLESVEAFTTALATRTAVPPDKISFLLRRPADALKKELGGIRCVERRFAAALEHQSEDFGFIGAFLEDLAPGMISKDHDWRDIFGELTMLPDEFEDFKRVALVSYLQYLRHRIETIQSVLDCRTPEETAETSVRATATQSISDGFTSTDVWEQPVLSDIGEDSGYLRRLPKGQPVAVHVGPEASVRLRLGKRDFRLVYRDGFYLLDASGTGFELARGRNTVGRHPECTVLLADTDKTLSRRHLVIDVADGDRVIMTDISSLGTFVAVEAATVRSPTDSG